MARSQDPLSSFVYEPYSRPVEYARISIRTRDLGRLFVKMAGERAAKSDSPNGPINRARHGLSLKTFVTGLKTVLSEPDQFHAENVAILNPILDWSRFVRDNGAPADKYPNRLTHSSNVDRMRMTLRTIPENVVGPSIPLDEINDALHITENYQEDLTVIEATALQADTVESFVSFVKSLPDIGEKVKIIKRGSQFSSRFSTDLVTVAVKAWARSIPTVERIPQFILDYLSGAFTYLSLSEWRTSIVLSAIALESLLAEMYETEFGEVAPDQPLGNLYSQIRDKSVSRGKENRFPKDIATEIEACNQSRIAAVHRGGRQLSDKDAHNTVHSVARILIWYYFRRT